MTQHKYARCNFDGRPISPEDKAIVDKFKAWLKLSDEEKRDPKWHKFLGIDCTTQCSHDPYTD